MRLFLLLAVFGLAGCAQQTQYIRADGQNASQQQIEMASATCAREAGDHYCMVAHGYFAVPANEAESKREQLAAIAQADEQRRQAELAAFEKERARKIALEKSKKRKRTAAARPAVSRPNQPSPQLRKSTSQSNQSVWPANNGR